MTVMFTVRVIDEDEGVSGADSEYLFEQDVVTIGRAHDNMLVITDPSKQVSSYHARVEKSSNEWYLHDLKSTNGTQHNTRVLTSGETVLLRDGDVVVLGDFELRFEVLAVPTGADQTQAYFDADRLAGRLAEKVSLVYAEHVHDDAGSRCGAIATVVREATKDLLPEQSRAVLNMLRASMGSDTAAPAAANEGVDKREELYRAGHEILRALSNTFVSDDQFKRPEDAGRFGQLLNQTLHVTMEWLAKCLEGRREFETQFGADVTMMFALEGNPLKNGQDGEAIGTYLLDWRGGRDISRVRSDLEDAFRDLSLHQLGLVAGAQEAVKAVLQRLDPAVIGEMTANKSKGWLKVLPGGNREWDFYKAAYAELLAEKTKLYEELITPSVRKGYLAAHEKDLTQEAGDEEDSTTQ